jgi:hypothetical protein
LPWRRQRLPSSATRRCAEARRLLVLDRDAIPAQTPSGMTARPAYEWMLAATPIEDLAQ